MILAILCLLNAITSEPITQDRIESYYAAQKARGDKAEHPMLAFAGMEIGDIGKFPYAFDPAMPTPFVTTAADRVIGTSEFVVAVQCYDIESTVTRYGTRDVVGPPMPVKSRQYLILVSGVSTRGLADDSGIRLPGGYKVTGTKKAMTSKGEKTLYVVEPFRLPFLK